MRRSVRLYSTLLGFATLTTSAASGVMSSTPKGAFAYSATLADGREKALSDYAGKALLIANVASRCGYTQSGYADLAGLAKKYAQRGLQVLVFPCNQVNSAEGDKEEGEEDEEGTFTKHRILACPHRFHV